MDVVLDGFCGTGMTGVAARESGRFAVLNDLSPVATFISNVNNTRHDGQRAVDVLNRIIAESERVWGYVYQTLDSGRKSSVNYFVWSDVFTCPECVAEFPFFPHGVVHHGNKVETQKAFPCPSCGAELNVRRVERVLLHEGKKRALVWVNAGAGKTRVNRAPNDHDLALVKELDNAGVPDWFPTDAMDPNGYSAKLAQLGDKAITDVSRFLSKRNLIVFSDLWSRVNRIDDVALRNLCKATLTSIFTVVSERQGYFGGGGGMSGNLYMPIVRMEKNVYDSLHRKIGRLEDAERMKLSWHTATATTTQSLGSRFARNPRRPLWPHGNPDRDPGPGR